MNIWLFTAIIFPPIYLAVTWLFNRFWPDPDKWPWEQ